MNTCIKMAVGPDPLQMLKLTTGGMLDFTCNISEKLCFLAWLILAQTID